MYWQLLFVEFCAERYLSMSKDEKRKLYTCGSKYITLEEVETWQKHTAKRNVRRRYPSGNHCGIVIFYEIVMVLLL